MTRVQRRDPNAIYHKMTVAELASLTPGFDWPTYFREVGAPAVTTLNVDQPDFMAAFGRLLASTPPEAWHAYLRWHLAEEAAPALGSAFVNENFRFQSALTGAKELLPRWKRCVRATDEALGEALGQAYVARTFTPQAKARALAMVRNMEAVLRERLGVLAWMGDSTRAQAIAKLDAFANKIGYPDRWRDYSKLGVQTGPFAANVLRANEFEVRRDLGEIGKPLDRLEWGMSPPTVNAYYNPHMNEIVFPAGILQPPFFDPQADDAVNYGGMGAVIGHEMTHGFDDQGSQYDAAGNLANWWGAADRERYTQRTTLIANQFGGYTIVDSTLHLNGRLTLGENIADLGGLTIAYYALEHSMRGKPRPPKIDGFTPEQRFFLAWAQIWRENTRPEFQRMLVTVDPHAPGMWRTNGPLSNMPEFARAWGCTTGDPMVRPDSLRAQIW
jgi:predicted metalloendopeptidase